MKDKQTKYFQNWISKIKILREILYFKGLGKSLKELKKIKSIKSNYPTISTLPENVKNIIENDFRSIDDQGYLVIPSQVLNAADYGVPQNRERIIFIGLNKKYLKKEIERLRILFEDALLSDDEREFVEEVIKKIKNGDTKDFVSIDELDEI